jgi:hypothetical protein
MIVRIFILVHLNISLFTIVDYSKMYYSNLKSSHLSGKDLLALNQDNVSKCGDISVYGVLFQ